MTSDQAYPFLKKYFGAQCKLGLTDCSIEGFIRLR